MGIGMDTGDNSPPEQQETFWGSAQAPESTTPTQPAPQTVSAPQVQIMGNLAQQPQTHFSATVSNSAQSGYIGSPSITSDYDMSEKKKGMNWGQFTIGFFAPIVVMMLLTGISEFGNGDWDDRWDEVYQIEMITIFSDNGTFTHTFTEEVTDNGRFEVNWCYSMGEYEGYDYYCNERFSNGDVIIEIVERKNGGSEVAVGEYTGLNHTIWLTTDSHNSNEIEFELEFIDRALEDELNYSSGGDMVDTFFCLMPLVGIVAVVISFARGNKSLGYGLIASVSIPIILSGSFLILLLLFGF
jgi:hypothetical protein